MKKIAITGTICSGKSTFAHLIADRGWPVFDADLCGKEFLKPGNAAYDRIIEHFGQGITGADGTIINARLAAIIFHDEEQRRTLNSILHPMILSCMQAYFEKEQESLLVFAEVPLLYEAGWERYFDMIVCITCHEEKAIERCMVDRGYSYEEACARIRSQIDAGWQIANADKVFYNDGTIDELNASVDHWLKEVEKETRAYGIEGKGQLSD